MVYVCSVECNGTGEGGSQCQYLWSGCDPEGSQNGERQGMRVAHFPSALQCKKYSGPQLATNFEHTMQQ